MICKPDTVILQKHLKDKGELEQADRRTILSILEEAQNDIKEKNQSTR